MADDGRAAAVSETGSFGAGAGGKLRTTRSHRRSATPYERPPLSRLRSSSDAARPAADGPNDGSGSWFSKLVTRPASRILYGASSRLFSSVFGKSESALLPPPVEEMEEEEKHDTSPEAYNVLPDGHTDELDSKKETLPEVVDKEPTSSEHAKGSDPNWVAEVEQFLSQKTISSDEFNHLSKFLQSRTIGLSEVSPLKSETAETLRQKQSCKENNGMVSEDETEKTLRTRCITERPSENAMTAEEPLNANNIIQVPTDVRHNTLWNNHITRNPSSFAVPSNVHDDNCASPLEFAKAYMSRTSVYGPISRIKEKTSVASNCFTPKLSRFSLAPKSPACFPGTDREEVHNYFTPSQRSRIRLHNMVKRPYSSTSHRTASEKVTTSGYVQWEHSDRLNNFSKKRSPLVDDIFSSGVPIRRVRAKSDATNPGFLSTDSTSYTAKNNSGESSMTSYMKIDVESNIRSPKDGEEETPAAPSCFPSESSDIGAKISKHLDQMFQSSKDKKAEIIASKTGEASSNEKGQLLRLDVTPVHSDSLREATKTLNSTWKSRNQLQIVPPLPHVHGRAGSGNASILVSDPVTRDLGSNRGDTKIGSGNALNVENHCVENLMPEVPLKENEDHKDRQISEQESAVTKTEGQKSLPISFHKNNITEAAHGKADEKLSPSSTDGSGFTFPVPMTALVCEPPETPSVSPSVVPSFSFGANDGGKNLVFSFSSSSTDHANTTTPQFSFDAANKTNLSFSSAVAPPPTLASRVPTSPEDRNGNANGIESSSQTLFSTFSNVNQGRSMEPTSLTTPSFSNTDKTTPFTSFPPKFSSSAFASVSASSSMEPTSTTFSSLLGETKPPFSFSNNPFISGGSSAPAFSFSSANHKRNAAALDFRANGSSQTGQGTRNAPSSNPLPSVGFGSSSSALGNSPFFQFSSPKPDLGQMLSQGTAAPASGDAEKSTRRFIKINRDRSKRR